MKTITLLGVLLSYPLLLTAQTTCTVAMATSVSSPAASSWYDNRTTACSTFMLGYSTSGATNLLILVQMAPDSSGSPGTPLNMIASAVGNPSSNLGNITIPFGIQNPPSNTAWVRVNLIAITGSISYVMTGTGGAPVPPDTKCIPGVTCDANYTSLAAACSAANGGWIALTQFHAALLTQPIACPMLGWGGVLQTASGQTVTIPYPSAGSYQIFDTTTLGGTIAFSSRGAMGLDAKWWGAKFNGVSTTDDTIPLQKSINASCTSGMQLSFPANSTTYVNTPTSSVLLNINCTTGLSIRGNGIKITTTDTTGADLMAAISTVSGNPRYDISNVQLVGSGTSSGNCFRITGTGTAIGLISNITSSNCRGSGKSGIWLGNVEDMQINSATVSTNDWGLKMTTSSNLIVINNLNANGNVTYNANLNSSSGVTCVTCGFQSATNTSLHLDTLDHFTCVGCWFENNNSAHTSGIYAIEMSNVLQSNISFHGSFLNNPDIWLGGSTGNNSNNVFGIGAVANGGQLVSIATTQASGNSWTGITSNVFGGAGITPFRESIYNAKGPQSGNWGYSSTPTPASLPQVVSCNGTCTIDMTAGVNVEVTLTGSSTLNVTATEPGTTPCFAIIENGTGGYTWTWQAGVFIGGMTIVATPNARNYQCFYGQSTGQFHATGIGTTN